MDQYTNLYEFDFSPLCNNMGKGDMVVNDGAGHVSCIMQKEKASLVVVL